MHFTLYSEDARDQELPCNSHPPTTEQVVRLATNSINAQSTASHAFSIPRTPPFAVIWSIKLPWFHSSPPFVFNVSHIHRVHHIAILRIVTFYPPFPIEPNSINAIHPTFEQSKETNGQIGHAKHVGFDIFILKGKEARIDRTNL